MKDLQIDANKVIQEMAMQSAQKDLEIIKYKVAYEQLRNDYNELLKKGVSDEDTK